MPVLLLIFSLSVFSQPWTPSFSPWFSYQATPSCEPSDTQDNYESDSSYSEPLPAIDPYGDQTEHYSWDNLYLCQYCDTEIIINVYGEGQRDEERSY